MQQINFTTKQAYTGNNELMLARVQRLAGFESGEWLTFVQANNCGKKIKKGAKGFKISRVIEFDKVRKNKKVTKETAMRSYTVFNIAQTEDVKVVA